jgi:hypothetical protein
MSSSLSLCDVTRSAGVCGGGGEYVVSVVWKKKKKEESAGSVLDDHSTSFWEG